MITVEKSIFINKPVKDVYAFVVGEGNYTKWQPEVIEVIEGGPRNTVGSSFTEVHKFMGQEMRTTLQITFLEPSVKWVGKVIKGPVPYEVTITYEASDDGAKFTTKVVGEPKGFFKLNENLVATQLEKGITEDGQRLKALLEKS